MLVSRLKKMHLPQMQELLELRSRIGKQRLSENEVNEAVSTIEQTMQNLPDNVLYWGVWEHKKLQGFMSQSFWRARPDDWVMTFCTLRPDKEHANYETNGMDALWQISFDTARSYGRRIARWSMPAAWARTQARTQKQSPTLAGCQIETYLYVPAGTLPAERLDQWVFGERVKPYDVIMKKAQELKYPSAQFNVPSSAARYLP